MPQRMAAKSVAAEQNDVDREHDRANADAKSMIKPDRLPNIIAQDQNENEREVEKITMHILHD